MYHDSVSGAMTPAYGRAATKALYDEQQNEPPAQKLSAELDTQRALATMRIALFGEMYHKSRQAPFPHRQRMGLAALAHVYAGIHNSLVRRNVRMTRTRSRNLAVMLASYSAKQGITGYRAIKEHFNHRKQHDIVTAILDSTPGYESRGDVLDNPSAGLNGILRAAFDRAKQRERAAEIRHGHKKKAKKSYKRSKNIDPTKPKRNGSHKNRPKKYGKAPTQ